VRDEHPGRPKVLVVDDEPQIRRFLRISLTAEGYRVVEAETGREGIRRCATEQPDLVILDLGLPDLDGQEVVRRVREWSTTPIIVLSVRAGEGDKVQALDNGADDYAAKPFGVAELAARVRAALRRRGRAATEKTAFVSGDLRIDVPARRVTVGGEEVRLSRKEFDLLRLLALHEGKVLTHQMLLREIWGPAHAGDTHYLRIYVGHIREKLGDDPTHPRFIVTEPGVGYRLRADLPET
jgi:two-component system KDP operon response regulator KdpE